MSYAKGYLGIEICIGLSLEVGIIKMRESQRIKWIKENVKGDKDVWRRL